MAGKKSDEEFHPPVGLPVKEPMPEPVVDTCVSIPVNTGEIGVVFANVVVGSICFVGSETGLGMIVITPVVVAKIKDSPAEGVSPSQDVVPSTTMKLNGPAEVGVDSSSIVTVTYAVL